MEGLLEPIPIQYLLPTDNEKISSNKEDVIFSKNIDYPNFSLGFQHFIHANKNKLDIMEQFEGKKKVYLITHPYEVLVDNYEESIHEMTKKYFKNNENIVGRGFYKMWELIQDYKLLDFKNDITTLHINDGEGGSMQASMYYRMKKNNKDKYNIIKTSNVEGKFLNIPSEYKKYITKDFNNKAELITAYGELPITHPNLIEQDAYRLLIDEIYTAFLYQKKQGNFVIKFFETFTQTSVKLIKILTEFDEKVYIVKPNVSRLYNVERFIVCLNFKYDDKDKELQSIINKFNNIITKFKDNKNNIIDIFSKISIDNKTEFGKKIIESNVHLANEQYKQLSNIINYIVEQNFYGDLYQEYRDKQITANLKWLKKYMI